MTAIRVGQVWVRKSNGAAVVITAVFETALGQDIRWRHLSKGIGYGESRVWAVQLGHGYEWAANSVEGFQAIEKRGAS